MSSREGDYRVLTGIPFRGRRYFGDLHKISLTARRAIGENVCLVIDGTSHDNGTWRKGKEPADEVKPDKVRKALTMAGVSWSVCTANQDCAHNSLK